MTSFEDHLKRQIAFSKGAFGPGPRTSGVIDHIRKELGEVEDAKSKYNRLLEWGDVAILGLEGLWRAAEDYANEQARFHRSPQPTTDEIAGIAITYLLSKQSRNEARVWPDWRTADPGKAIEHVREGDDR